MELNISNIDIVVILLFVVGIIWWALKNRKNENASEYFLAGKSQNWQLDTYGALWRGFYKWYCGI